MTNLQPLLGGAERSVAIVDADSGESWTYAQLWHRVEQRQAELASYDGGLVFLGASTTPATVIDYLALTGLGACVALLDPAVKASRGARWVAAFQPEGVWGFEHLAPRVEPSTGPGIGDEAVLLATSGSTGNPEFVRLSMANVVANANQITAALRLDRDERALAYLPLFYSFGLSILNSHLRAGASVVLSRAGVVDPRFVSTLQHHEVTSVSGVPYSFELFARTGLFERDLPSLRHVTQAGGRFSPERALCTHEQLAARGASLWLMYGQTEATARMTVLPPEQLPDAVGTVGYPLPGATITTDDDPGSPTGQILYTGPNVMLGYAHQRSDLDGRDQLGGTLATGDLGRIDDQGRIVITGRAKRMAKVFGVRFNLDDIEQQLAAYGPLGVVDGGEGLRVVIESDDETVTPRALERCLGLAPRSVDLVKVGALPRTSSGKVDYAALGAL